MKLIKKIQSLLKIDFVRFCIVGGSGFVINTAILGVLYKRLGWPIFTAQLIAGEIALFSNFILHHNWTYKERRVKKPIRQLLIQFHVTSWVAIIGSAALVSGGVNILHIGYLLALIISSVIALGWNFLWSRFIIWKHYNEIS